MGLQRVGQDEVTFTFTLTPVRKLSLPATHSLNMHLIFVLDGPLCSHSRNQIDFQQCGKTCCCKKKISFETKALTFGASQPQAMKLLV